jgi:hypothetical protein
VSASHRRAALELHRLAPEDREWVLSQLGKTEHERLLPLLAELREMNFQVDDEDLPSLEAASQPARAASEDGPMQRLRRANADAVCAALQHEPEWVVGALCELESWPWAGEVANRCGTRVAPRLSADPYPPVLREALIRLVAERLPRLNGVNGHAHHPALNGDAGGWRALWPKVKQWLP